MFIDDIVDAKVVTASDEYPIDTITSVEWVLARNLIFDEDYEAFYIGEQLIWGKLLMKDVKTTQVLAGLNTYHDSWNQVDQDDIYPQLQFRFRDWRQQVWLAKFRSVIFAASPGRLGTRGGKMYIEEWDNKKTGPADQQCNFVVANVFCYTRFQDFVTFEKE